MMGKFFCLLILYAVGNAVYNGHPWPSVFFYLAMGLILSMAAVFPNLVEHSAEDSYEWPSNYSRIKFVAMVTFLWPFCAIFKCVFDQVMTWSKK